MARNRIDWDAQPLADVAKGCLPTFILALRLGVTCSAVTWAMRRRGIKRRRFDWDAQPLGLFPDAVLAAALGVSDTTVGRARNKRMISPCVGQSRALVDWDRQPLGVFPDKVIMSMTGASKSAVVDARRSRGIRPSVHHFIAESLAALQRRIDALAREHGVNANELE